jgi:hypothetical protein
MGVDKFRDNEGCLGSLYAGGLGLVILILIVLFGPPNHIAHQICLGVLVVPFILLVIYLLKQLLSSDD